MIKSSTSIAMPESVSTSAPKLYLLTNDDPYELLYKKLEIALATGAISLLQIRRKRILAQPDGQSKLYAEAEQIIALAKEYNVPVVINDNIELAAKLGVGVHLGQQDGSMTDAKSQLGLHQMIGRTCHNDAGLVAEAHREGASYAAMGAIFSSSTKPNAQIVSRQQLIDGCQQDIPICVIGGLRVENIEPLAGLPIAYIAVVGDIMDLPLEQIALRCQHWQQALAKWHTPAI